MRSSEPRISLPGHLKKHRLVKIDGLGTGTYKSTWSEQIILIYPLTHPKSWGVFSSRKNLALATVALVFVFIN